MAVDSCLLGPIALSPHQPRWPGFQTALWAAALVPWKAIALLLLSRSVMSNSCDLKDCSPPGSSVHGILQSRILEWAAISFSRESFQPRDRIYIACIAGGSFTTEPPGILNTRTSVFGVSESCIVGSVFCTAGCLAASLASTLPVHKLNCYSQKWLQTLPHVFWGRKLPQIETSLRS